jgi:hypothetical protein
VNARSFYAEHFNLFLRMSLNKLHVKINKSYWKKRDEVNQCVRFAVLSAVVICDLPVMIPCTLL